MGAILGAEMTYSDCKSLQSIESLLITVAYPRLKEIRIVITAFRRLRHIRVVEIIHKIGIRLDACKFNEDNRNKEYLNWFNPVQMQ